MFPPKRPRAGSPTRTPKGYWGLFTNFGPNFGPPVFPDKFKAGYKKPPDIIRPGCDLRFVHRDMPWWAFVLVDGACTNNGRLGAQGGWAVVYGRQNTLSPGQASGRLEEQGPFGDPFAPTSNRAELRASIAALRLCEWREEGFKRLVIATDSSYVVEGATSWSKTWAFNGWRTAGGAPVQNRDLWLLLLGQISYWASQGLFVLFWKIPRELNQEADSAAKAASLYGFREPEFVDWVIREPDPPPLWVPEMAGSVRPWERVVILCPHSKELVDYRYQPLLSRIRRHAHLVELGQTTDQCFDLLSKGEAPTVILITDNQICWSAALFLLVQKHLRKGCIVVLTGEFGRFYMENVTNKIFEDLGLAWEVGDTMSFVGEKPLATFPMDHLRLILLLPPSYLQCGLSVTGVPPREQIYAQGYLSQTMTAMAKIDQGYLCFVGDESPKSEDVIMAMCCGL